MVQNEVARFFMAHVVQRNDKEAPEFMARPAALHPISASALAIANIRCTAAAALVGRLVIRYGQTRAQKLAKSTNREHWIQRITFAAETNAACSRGSSDITHTHTHTQTLSITIPSPLANITGLHCERYCPSISGRALCPTLCEYSTRE